MMLKATIAMFIDGIEADEDTVVLHWRGATVTIPTGMIKMDGITIDAP